jgi:predicted RNA binding protein YcfA (HicA-like mRNA interferase family)
VCIYTHISNRKIIQRLTAAGWVKVGQVGSHVQLKHPEHGGKVTIPHPKKDIPIGTIKSIESQSGVRLR